MTPARYVVGQLGNRMRYAVPRQLHQAGRLVHLFTDIAAVGPLAALRTVPAPLRPAGLRRLLGRVPEGIPRRLLTTYPRLGLQALRRIRAASTDAALYDAYANLGVEFARRVALASRQDAAGIYLFNSAALEALEWARAAGVRGVVEQTIAPLAYERSLLDEEATRWSGWTDRAPEDAAAFQAYADRERAEWEAADLVVCGSAFVRDAIAAVGGPADRCAVVPYGVPLDAFEVPDRSGRTGPLRVLTAGAIGLRKGAPYVAQAARRLGAAATFRWIGGVDLADAGRRVMEGAGVDLVGSVPKSEVAAQFAWADVFLLPSLCEGSATVTYEALAAGLPVVCTPHTGAIVRDGVEGFVVPIRDGAALADRLDRLRDPDLRAEMGRAAQERAAEGSEAAYGRRLLAVL